MSRAYTDNRHHTARFAKKPTGDGWTTHKGSTPPVSGEVYIELAHITAEGYAIGPRRRARFVRKEEWALPKNELGAIVAWRLAPEIEEAEFTPGKFHPDQIAAAEAEVAGLAER